MDIFMAWHLLKHRDKVAFNFNFTLQITRVPTSFPWNYLFW